MVTFEHDQILKRVSTNAIWPTVKEGGRTPPPFPSVFYKANTTVNDHGAPVVIPKICQDEQADYEGELVKHIFCFIFPLLFIICREIPLALEESSTEHGRWLFHLVLHHWERRQRRAREWGLQPRCCIHLWERRILAEVAEGPRTCRRGPSMGFLQGVRHFLPSRPLPSFLISHPWSERSETNNAGGWWSAAKWRDWWPVLQGPLFSSVLQSGDNVESGHSCHDRDSIGWVALPLIYEYAS